MISLSLISLYLSHPFPLNATEDAQVHNTRRVKATAASRGKYCQVPTCRITSGKRIEMKESDGGLRVCNLCYQHYVKVRKQCGHHLPTGMTALNRGCTTCHRAGCASNSGLKRTRMVISDSSSDDSSDGSGEGADVASEEEKRGRRPRRDPPSLTALSATAPNPFLVPGSLVSVPPGGVRAERTPGGGVRLVGIQLRAPISPMDAPDSPDLPMPCVEE